MSRLKLTLRSVTISLCLTSAAVAAYLLTPNLLPTQTAPSLEERIPTQIGDWRFIQTSLIPADVTAGNSMDQPYNQVVMRSYVNQQGKIIQLAVAWGEKQRQEVKIHRPELCYPAQGWQVVDIRNTTFPISNAHPITGKRMVARNRYGKLEAVSYWIRIGSIYSDSAWETRKHILLEGLSGHTPDGVLVRVSQSVTQPNELDGAFQQMEEFAAQLVAHTEPQARAMLIQ